MIENTNKPEAKDMSYIPIHWLTIRYWHLKSLPGLENLGHETKIRDTPETRSAIIDQVTSLGYSVMFRGQPPLKGTVMSEITVWIDKHRFGQR